MRCLFPPPTLCHYRLNWQAKRLLTRKCCLVLQAEWDKPFRRIPQDHVSLFHSPEAQAIERKTEINPANPGRTPAMDVGVFRAVNKVTLDATDRKISHTLGGGVRGEDEASRA